MSGASNHIPEESSSQGITRATPQESQKSTADYLLSLAGKNLGTLPKPIQCESLTKIAPGITLSRIPKRQSIALRVNIEAGVSTPLTLVDITVEFSDFLENESAVRHHLISELTQVDREGEKSLAEEFEIQDFEPGKCNIIRTERFEQQLSKDSELDSGRAYWCKYGNILISVHGREADFPTQELIELADELNTFPEKARTITATTEMLKAISDIVSYNSTVLDSFDTRRVSIRREVMRERAMTDKQRRETGEISYVASELQSDFKRLATALTFIKTQESKSGPDSALFCDETTTQLATDLDLWLGTLNSRCDEIAKLSKGLLARDRQIEDDKRLAKMTEMAEQTHKLSVEMHALAAETHALSVEAHEASKRAGMVAYFVAAFAPASLCLYMAEYVEYGILGNTFVGAGLLGSATFVGYVYIRNKALKKS